MEIEILDYIPDERGFRKGLVDIKIIYNAEKFECFRGLSFFEKEGRKWLAYPNTKRGDNWLPYYERVPEVNKGVLAIALDKLESHLNRTPTQMSDSIF